MLRFLNKRTQKIVANPKIDAQKDEDQVGKGCLLNMFRCENGPCIDEQFRCNGYNDCPFDTSDELDCNTNRKSLNPFRKRARH